MKDKTCIITGATAGIGLETAARLGALGARLLLVGRSREKGNIALAQLRTEVPGIEAEMYYADLSRSDEILRLAAALLDDAGRIDVLVNNAGAIFARRELRPMGLNALSRSIIWFPAYGAIAITLDRFWAGANC
jgi:short-subunit dehydrogenase